MFWERERTKIEKYEAWNSESWTFLEANKIKKSTWRASCRSWRVAMSMMFIPAASVSSMQAYPPMSSDAMKELTSWWAATRCGRARRGPGGRRRGCRSAAGRSRSGRRRWPWRRGRRPERWPWATWLEWMEVSSRVGWWRLHREVNHRQQKKI